MKHELIKIDDYLLIVSDDEIKVGDWYLSPNWYLVNQYGRGLLLCTQPATKEDIEHQHKYDCRLIIAHRPLNEAPYLDGVDVLPEIEGDLHIYDAIGYAGSEGHPDPQAFSDKQMALFQGYADGYEKAKETYKYTEEDILIIRNKLVDMLPTGDVSAWDMINAISSYTKWFDNFIQSLNQPKLPIAFECQMVTVKSYKDKMGNVRSEKTFPGTFTNSEGRTEWVGRYEFK